RADPAKVAHHAREARPEHESTRVQIIQIGSDHDEQPPKVPLVTRGVAMALQLGELGLDQIANLQAGFNARRRVPQQVAAVPPQQLRTMTAIALTFIYIDDNLST